jgi:fusion and transport protein UGO1
MAHPVQLSSSRDTPNPLRPYYRPPSIGLPPADVNATSASAGSSSSLGSSARHVFDDLDYSSFLNDGDSSSVADMGRKVLDQALWKYTSVLLAQPFDVAKTILQVRLATQLDAESTLRRRTSARFAVDQYPPSDDESDPDEPSYFTPTKPTRAAEDRSRSRRPRTPPSRDSREQSPAPHVLQLRRPDSVMEALSQLWQQAGAAAMWKATNATFIYNVLLKAVEGWTRNLLSALFDLPDPSSLASVPAEVVAGAMGGLDLADSPSPLASLGIAVAASAIAGLLLAPLDLVRTRYVVLSCPVRSHTDHSQTHSYTNHFTTACHPTKSPPPAESYNSDLSLPNHSPPLHTSDSVEYQYSSRPSSILPC